MPILLILSKPFLTFCNYILCIDCLDGDSHGLEASVKGRLYVQGEVRSLSYGISGYRKFGVGV